MTQQRDYISMT